VNAAAYGTTALVTAGLAAEAYLHTTKVSRQTLPDCYPGAVLGRPAYWQHTVCLLRPYLLAVCRPDSAWRSRHDIFFVRDSPITLCHRAAFEDKLTIRLNGHLNTVSLGLCGLQVVVGAVLALYLRRYAANRVSAMRRKDKSSAQSEGSKNQRWSRGAAKSRAQDQADRSATLGILLEALLTSVFPLAMQAETLLNSHMGLKYVLLIVSYIVPLVVTPVLLLSLSSGFRGQFLALPVLSRLPSDWPKGRRILLYFAAHAAVFVVPLFLCVVVYVV
jgi:hypothetical protein